MYLFYFYFYFVLRTKIFNEKVRKPINKKLEKVFLRKNIVAVSFFENCAIDQYS